MINWIDANSDPKLFLEMYHQYLIDLSVYSESVKNAMQTPDLDDHLIKNYLLDEKVSTYLVKSNKNIIGFISVQHVGLEYGIESPIWYIVEFFILPECRKQGFGKKMFKAFLDRHEGDFFYYIIKKNTPAKQFWSKMTETFSLNEVCRPDIDDSDPELEIHVFKRGE